MVWENGEVANEKTPRLRLCYLTKTKNNLLACEKMNSGSNKVPRKLGTIQTEELRQRIEPRNKDREKTPEVLDE